MSKTYKHQYLFDVKDWHINNCYVWGQEKKDVDSPFYKNPHLRAMWIDVGKRRKHYARQRNKQCRKKVKSLIHKEKYVESEYIKPGSIAWDIF